MKCMEEATGRAGHAEAGNLLRQQGSRSGSCSGSQEVRQLICWNVTIFTYNCTSLKKKKDLCRESYFHVSPLG